MILVCMILDRQTSFEEHLSLLAAAKQLPGEITVLLLGKHPEIERFQKWQGIQKLWWVELLVEQLSNPEVVAPLVANLAKPFHTILSSTAGRAFMPRLAGMLGVAMLSDVQKIQAPDQFVRAEYSGHVSVTVRLCEPIKLLTIETSAFESVEDQGDEVPLEKLNVTLPHAKAKLLEKADVNQSSVDLRSAKRVLAGGRGVSKEAWSLLEALAKQLNAAIGGSHPAVAGGYIEPAQLIGQSGLKIAPELYIALGISGAIQHTAGIKAAKVIVAINRDPKASIFEVADYGLIGDLEQILPELVKGLATKKE